MIFKLVSTCYFLKFFNRANFRYNLIVLSAHWTRSRKSFVNMWHARWLDKIIITARRMILRDNTRKSSKLRISVRTGKMINDCSVYCAATVTVLNYHVDAINRQKCDSTVKFNSNDRNDRGCAFDSRVKISSVYDYSVSLFRKLRGNINYGYIQAKLKLALCVCTRMKYSRLAREIIITGKPANLCQIAEYQSVII